MPLPGTDGAAHTAGDAPEPRISRRQLPTGRGGPAFRGHAIQEEDEDEED